MNSMFKRAVIVLAALLLSLHHQVLATPVLTYHNDNTRTGANTHETLLTPANVNTNSFGRLLKYEVDGYVYAQPLYFPGLGKHNAVFVATENNSVYAFDADSDAGPDGGLLWHASLGSGIDIVTNHEFGGRYHNNVYQDMLPRVGITGTPVIDSATGTLFVDAFTRVATETATNYHHTLHALNVTTGQEQPFGPVEVTASVPGSGIGSANGVIKFDPRQHQQRPALTLAGGILYVPFGSAADTDSYHGWVIGFDASNLQPLSNYVFNTTPNATRAQFGSHAGEGALWMGGGGLCVDANTNLYFEVANGSFSADSSLGNGVDYGDSFMKLSTAAHRLAVADFFTPFDQARMQEQDADFGSGAPLLLPDEVGSAAHPHLIVGGDKASKIYLVDRDNMGHYHTRDNHQIVQEVNAGIGQIFSTPAYFNFHLYYQGVGGVLKSFAISNGFINPTPDSMTRTSFSGFGTTPSISANGNSNAIVWTIQSDGAVRHSPAILHAYNVANLAIELYNSSQLPERDNPGDAVKMTVPTVADGKVFVGAQYALSVFGNGYFLPTPSISPKGGNFINSATVTLADTESGATIYYTLDDTKPTVHSIRYTGPFAVTKTGEITVIAIKPGAVNSGVASAAFVNTAAVGEGKGLMGQYWANTTNIALPNATITRTDSVVDFDWSTTGPDPLIGKTNFVARWSGCLQPQFDDTYELTFVSTGGRRLWINDRLLINDWMAHSSPIALKLRAQQLYNIRLEYFQEDNGGQVRLLWRRSSEKIATIPQTQLYPFTNPPPSITVVAPARDASYAASASVTVAAKATTMHNPLGQVEFFANGKSLGSLNSSVDAPVYALTTTGISEGRYTLTVVASDASGLRSTSAPVNITITPGSGVPYGLTKREKVAAFLNMPTTFYGSLPRLLSETGAFSDTPRRIPAGGLIPYAPNTPLWSDGAVKSRYLALPNNGGIITSEEQIRFRPTDTWMFPDGTVFVKNFDLVVNQTNASVPLRRLETRLLVRDINGAAYGVTYKWRPDNSEADLLSTAANEDILITNANGVSPQTWYYPSPADCLTCHTPAAGYVLGASTRQLNGNFTYPAIGKTDNQLRALNRLGLFNPAIDETRIASFPKLSALTDLQAPLEERARSYLDANCAQCHQPGGVGNFDARYDTPVAAQHIINAPAAVTLGIDNARIVMPLDTGHSVLYQRITSLVSTVKMPPLARNQVDAQAAQVMSDWINSLSAKQTEYLHK